LRKAAGRACGHERAIDNLVDSVDRFSFTGTATQNENAGDQLEMGVAAVGMFPVILTVLAQNDFGNANGLTTVAAQDTAEIFRRRFD